MRLRKKPQAEAAALAHSAVIGALQPPAGGFRALLAMPAARVNLEIGMGRGRFICQMAQIAPEQIFLGLEMRGQLVAEAISRNEPMPDNVRFIVADAWHLEELFATGEINKIYLNFSDPWPKVRHAKRRLTSPQYLVRYQRLLAADGELEMRTDNEQLYCYSLATLAANGWQLLEQNQKLPPQTAATEYELRFRKQGQAIYYLRAKRPLEE